MEAVDPDEAPATEPTETTEPVATPTRRSSFATPSSRDDAAWEKRFSNLTFDTDDEAHAADNFYRFKKRVELILTASKTTCLNYDRYNYQ